MIIVMQLNAQEQDISTVIEHIRAAGLREHVSRGAELVIIGAIGDEDRVSPSVFEMLPGVERVSRVTRQYKIVSRATHPSGMSFKVRGVEIGGPQFQVFAGVHAHSSVEYLNQVAAGAHSSGARLVWSKSEYSPLSPYEFDGFAKTDVSQLCAVVRGQKMPVAIELNDLQELDALLSCDVDLIQIGARSMQNRPLLRELGRLNKPVILRRGLSASVAEWLLAAESVAAGGNHHIIMCEQGVKGLLDVATIAWLKRETHLPVMVDVSHASAKSWMVPQLGLAAAAAGADGLMVDVHSAMFSPLGLTEQSLELAQFERMMNDLRAILPALGRKL